MRLNETLTDRQASFAAAWYQHRRVDVAAKSIGVSRATGFRLAKDPAVVAEHRRLQQEAAAVVTSTFVQSAQSVASRMVMLATDSELLSAKKPNVPYFVQFSAASKIIDYLAEAVIYIENAEKLEAIEERLSA